jgi:hypothetical protein
MLRSQGSVGTMAVLENVSWQHFSIGVQGAPRFSPLFPATCPFVIAVGATQINPNSTVYEPESACEQKAYSGGGFSNIFPMPLYQEEAVRGYLKHHPPPYTAEQYNNTGRVKNLFPLINRVPFHADASTRPAHIQICLLTGQYYFATISFFYPIDLVIQCKLCHCKEREFLTRLWDVSVGASCWGYHGVDQ